MLYSSYLQIYCSIAKNVLFSIPPQGLTYFLSGEWLSSKSFEMITEVLFRDIKIKIAVRSNAVMAFMWVLMFIIVSNFLSVPIISRHLTLSLKNQLLDNLMCSFFDAKINQV